jgi:hypothetical protein
VPFDLTSYRTILIQKSNFPIKNSPSIRAEVVLIKVEINILVLELLERLLSNGRSRRWRWRWRWRWRGSRPWLNLSRRRRGLFFGTANKEEHED